MQARTNKDFYDHISSMYDALADSSEHAARELGEKMLNLQPGEQVIEIGFGTGNSLLHLAKAVQPNGKVVGLDVSEGMQRVAQQKVEAAGVAESVELQVGNAVALDQPDDSFDAGYLSFTLELFSEEDTPAVLSELKRVLRPGGRLAVVSMATVLEGESESVLEKTYKWMHRHFPHIVDCRPIDPAMLLQEAGLEIMEQKRMDIWTMPVAAVLAKK